MKLSIIIVNYNVKFFIEQCLHAVIKAVKGIDAEIFVVDNNSLDGSCAMILEKFPQVVLIENDQNLGFSKANNQAIRISKGEYVLLLNPDTVVEEESFSKVLHFMDTHPLAGGLGVKMIDGKGKFLPESKRGLPLPLVAFYKIFGLSNLFPKSKIFAKYHLGYLNENEVHEIEILSGAFMLMRKETLNKVGLLDEEYFMYGEDIDLSYRILKGGYKNYYFPETTIIHYKGESTKKGSINYVKVFYNAMIIFARKHFSSGNAKAFSFFINLAIYFRAFLAIFSRIIKKFLIPVLDALIFYIGFLAIAPFWESYKFNDAEHFPITYFTIAIPVYIIIWLLSILFSGGYEKPVSLPKILRGILVGTGIILMVYALLPEHYRFSRAMLLMATIWGSVAITLFRVLLHIAKINGFQFSSGRQIRLALVGESEEVARVINILKLSSVGFEYIGLIHPDESKEGGDFLGKQCQLKEIIEINRINELIFCASNLSSNAIIREMLRLEGTGVAFKIAPPESISIIGSNSIETAGELYAIDLNNIIKPHNLRKKRLFDFAASMLFLVFSPLILLFIPSKKRAFQNIISVLLGIKSWVGFYYRTDVNTKGLPLLKRGILSWCLVNCKENDPPEKIEKTNLIYAKDYKMVTDLDILIKGIRFIGKT